MMKKITFKIFRFNKEVDYLPHYSTYTIEVSKEEVILDVLGRIKSDIDGTLSYRRSCRHGICGSCGVKVNNRSIISCKTNVYEMVELFGDELIIDPQNKAMVAKDLIVEKKDFWQKYNNVKPYLLANIDEHPTKENLIEPEIADKIEDADYCIQCGACYYACPAISVNPDYLGPAALAKAYRFTSDVRDHALLHRLEIVNEMGSGIWDCVKCFECAEACPKGVNPIDKITKLHNQTFEHNVAKNNVAVRHAVGFKWSIKKHGLLDEGELVRYSEGNIGVMKHLCDALSMFKKGKIVMPWNMPKSTNMDEIKKLIEISSTAKF
jgi:succinate dehydrogenase / fumarate reductase iron-sulfur subunit